MNSKPQTTDPKTNKAVRVLLTGLGPLCSLGHDRKTFWNNLLAGRGGVGPVARLAGAPVAFGAEVAGFHPDGLLDPKEFRYDRATQFAIVAAHWALQDAGLLTRVGAGFRPRPTVVSGPEGPSHAESPDSAPLHSSLFPPLFTNLDRAGIILGSSRGAAELLERSHARFLERGPDGVGPHASPHTTPGNLAGAVAKRFGLRGPSLFVSAACSSASQAIGLAFDLIRSGRADVMLAGGTEACLTPFCMSMFAATGILSRRADDPARACRPFGRDRDGIVIGEGAGIVVLESVAHARARGAKAYCEIRGFGATCDAHSLTGIPADGEGLARAIGLALADAGLRPEDVDYVNAHGTGTIAGDRAETAAIKAALGARAHKVAVGATKSMTGHLIGAAGGIEAIVCALAIAEGVVPPTINLENPDPACDLDYVPGAARRMAVRVALSNSMGFGGNNACVVLSACR